jgi:hypothetical protein
MNQVQWNAKKLHGPANHGHTLWPTSGFGGDQPNGAGGEDSCKRGVEYPGFSFASVQRLR